MNIKIKDVRAIKGDSAFLIDDGKTSVLYDSGFAFTGYSVVENIKKELGNRALDYIFLTHSHYDHALGSVYAKRVYSEAKVVAGKYAESIFSRSGAKAVMRQLDRKFAHANEVLEYEDLIDELSVDIAVADGDKIMAGDMCFTALDLPGHTKCSVGYYLESEGILLGTESLGVYVGEGVVLPSYLVGYNMAIESIKRVMELKADKILVPHFGVLQREEADFYLEEGLKSAVKVKDKIVEILNNGGTKEQAISWFVEEFYTGKVKEIYPYDAMMLNTGITVDLIEKEFILDSL